MFVELRRVYAEKSEYCSWDIIDTEHECEIEFNDNLKFNELHIKNKLLDLGYLEFGKEYSVEMNERNDEIFVDELSEDDDSGWIPLYVLWLIKDGASCLFLILCLHI